VKAGGVGAPSAEFVIHLTTGAVTPPVGTILCTVRSIVGVSVELRRSVAVRRIRHGPFHW